MHKKLLVELLVLLLTLGMVACRQNNVEDMSNTKTISETMFQSSNEGRINEEALKTVITNLFNAPNEEFILAFNDGATVIGEGISESSPSRKNEENSVIKREFGNYFTEYTLDKFISDYLSPYQLLSKKSGTEIKAKEINITKTSSEYNFFTKIQYTKGSETKIIDVKGDAQFLENGKITSFRILSDGKLLEWLQSDK